VAFDVATATEADRPALLELIREMMPGVDAAARFAWLYERNPAGRALTWIAREDGEVAGCTSYFPFRMQLDGSPVLAALGGDGYVRPRFRRRGLGAQLHEAARQAMRDHDIACMYGAPGAMNVTPLKHGGSHEIGMVARWVRPLRGAALGAPRPFDRLIRGVLRPRFVPYLEPMVRDDPRVDEVWAAIAPSLPLAAVRDATFYTWRFIDAPAYREPPYVIVLRGRPIAACALEVTHRGRDVWIVDLLAAREHWHSALAAIARHAAETDAHVLDIKLMELDGKRRRMWRAGFARRDAKPFLVALAPGGDPRFLDPTRWFYCGGDSDLDAIA